MLSFFIGLIGVLIALIGWFGFGSVIALIVGTALYIVETIIEWKTLNPGAKVVDLVIFIIGAVIALIVKNPFYIGGMIALNIYSGVMALFSIPMIVTQLKMFFKLK
jgi:hypothetical protein